MEQLTRKYRRPSLFEDFLSANSIIHIEKNAQKWQFFSQKMTFIIEFRDYGPEWRNVSTANNEGNL